MVAQSAKKLPTVVTLIAASLFQLTNSVISIDEVRNDTVGWNQLNLWLKIGKTSSVVDVIKLFLKEI